MAKHAQKTTNELRHERDHFAKVLKRIAKMPKDCGGNRGNRCCGCVGKAISEAETALEIMGLLKG